MIKPVIGVRMNASLIHLHITYTSTKPPHQLRLLISLVAVLGKELVFGDRRLGLGAEFQGGLLDCQRLSRYIERRPKTGGKGDSE